LTVGWLAVEAVVCSRYCMRYEVSTLTTATSYTQRPEAWKRPCQRHTSG